MRSPASAFTWQLWHRSRRTAAAMALYAAGLAIVAHLPDAPAWRQTIFMAAIPLSFGALFLLASFTFPEADLLARHSGFPSWMLVLPVRTWELAFWPMLYGAITAALCWLVPTTLVLTPLGVPDVPVWPAAMIGALLACVQALAWAPMGMPYLRVILALILTPVLVTLGINAALRGVPSPALTAGFAGLAGLAFAAAVGGLARARRGEIPEWRGNEGTRERENERTRERGNDGAKRRVSPFRSLVPSPPSFASTFRAQLWYEWRAGGAALPLVVAVLCLLVSVPFAWVRELAPLDVAPDSSLGGIQVNLWLKLQQSYLFLPPLTAAILGCGRRRHETQRKDHSLDPFFSTRPFSSAGLISARMATAALSTLLAWGIMLLFATTWLLLPACDGETSGPLLALLRPHVTLRTGLVLLGLLAILVAWTWKNQIQGLFADVSGRPWIVFGVPFLAHGFVLALLVALVGGLDSPFGEQLRNAQRSGLLLRGAGVLVAAKALTAGIAFRALLRRRLISRRALVGLVGVWALGTSGLFAMLSWLACMQFRADSLDGLLVGTYLPLLGHHVPAELHSTAYLALLSLLFLPLARLAAAPLALELNRHR